MSTHNPITMLDLSYRLDLDDDLRTVVQTAVTSGRALVVAPQTSAKDIAPRVEQLGLDTVLIVADPAEPLSPMGYVFPEWVKHQVDRTAVGSILTLDDAIEELARQPISPTREHLHEWLNFDRPTLNRCPGRKPSEAHDTFGPVPCALHR